MVTVRLLPFSRRGATALLLALAAGCAGASTRETVVYVVVTPPPDDAAAAPEDVAFAATADAGPAPVAVLPDAGAAPLDAGATSAVAVVADAGPAPVADAGAAAPLEFVIVPMHLVPAPGATGENARIDLELRADGTLRSHAQLVGQVAGGRILGARGQEILAVAADGTVVLSGTPTRIRLLDNGDLVMPTGVRLTFADDGTPLSVPPGGAPQRGPFRLTGLRPEARRTAGLLALVVATVPLPRGR